ncbi:hypothetical protein ACOSP7_008249 [Xanthoceras sorbifolium]
MPDSKWEVLDRKALGTIRLTLSKSVAFNIKNETITVSLMAALSSMYEQPSATNKVHLIKTLFNLKMAEGGSFRKHLNNFNEVTDQLTSVTFSDKVRALLILGQLPESWRGIVTAISSSAGKSSLKFDVILTEEIRMQSYNTSTSGSALNVENRGRNSNRGNERGRSTYRSKSKNRRSKSRNPKNSQSSKTVVECWKCRKIRHYKNQCRSWKNDDEVKAEANVASTSGTNDALICSLESKEESWVLDSGASFHATSRRELFERYVLGISQRKNDYDDKIEK